MMASCETGEGTVPLLRACHLFAEVGPKELAALAERGRQRVYHRSQIIVYPEMRREQVVVLGAGAARLFRSSPDGHELTLSRFDAGDIYSLPLLWSGDASTSALEAGTDGTVVCHLPRAELCSFLDGHPKALRTASQILAQTAVHLAIPLKTLPSSR